MEFPPEEFDCLQALGWFGRHIWYSLASLFDNPYNSSTARDADGEGAREYYRRHDDIQFRLHEEGSMSLVQP